MSVSIDCLTCGWHDDAEDLPTGVAAAEDHACPGTRLRPAAPLLDQPVPPPAPAPAPLRGPLVVDGVPEQLQGLVG